MPLLPPRMLQIKEHTLITFFVVFTFRFTLKSFKEFGGALGRLVKVQTKRLPFN
jgi:hypothetical protein